MGNLISFRSLTVTLLGAVAMGYLLMAVWNSKTARQEHRSEQETAASPSEFSTSSVSEAAAIPAGLSALDQELRQAQRVVEEQPTAGRKMLVGLLSKTGINRQILDSLSSSYANEARDARTIDDEAAVCDRQVQQYEQLAASYPDWSELLYRLASQRIVLQRLQPGRMDQLDAAVRELKHVIGLANDAGNQTDEASGYFQLGRAYKHQGDSYRAPRDSHQIRQAYRLAVDAFSTTLQIEPERIDALGEVILIRLAQGDIEVAVEALRNHMPRVKRQHLQGKMSEMLGALLGQQGDSESSALAFLDAVTQNPKLMGSYLHLAANYQTGGDYEQAESILKRSIYEEPHFIEGHLALAGLLQGVGRRAGSVHAYRQLLAVPKPQAVFTGMLPSRALYRNGLYYRASAELADVYFQSGEIDMALVTAQRAANYQPLQAPLLDLMGRIYVAKSDAPRAERNFLEAIRLAKFPDAHFHLAQLYAKRPALELARKHLKLALNSQQDFNTRSEARRLLRELNGESSVPPD